MEIVEVSPGQLFSELYPFERGGTESQILGISRELARRGHQIIITGRFKDFDRIREMSGTGIRFLALKPPNLRDQAFLEIPSCMLYSRSVTRAVSEMEPDIMCLNDRFAGFYPSKLATPKTFTAHNPDAMKLYRDFYIEQNRLNSVLFGIKNRMERTVMNRSDAVIALTGSYKDFLETEGVGRTYVVPNAVDPNNYSNKGDDGFILSAGRLSKVKGLAYLLDAFSQIRNDTDFELLIVGSGTENENLQRIATSKGIQDRVRFIPMVDKKELAHYLSKCSVFVLPSLFETMSVTMLEAMASQKPVIASRIPGPKDVIEHGRNGLLFDKGDVANLSKLLRETLSDNQLRLRLGEQARNTILTSHSFERAAVQYEEIFKAIAR